MRAEALATWRGRALDNAPPRQIADRRASRGLERIADVPIYAPTLVRRADLQHTPTRRPVADLPRRGWQSTAGDAATRARGAAAPWSGPRRCHGPAAGTVRVPPGHPSPPASARLFGPVTVEKA